MPSWANHFRTADKLLDRIDNLNTEYFIIGNIAADCGIPTGNSGEYIPSSAVTHFTAQAISNKTDCDYNYIYEHYIKDETDIYKRSFYTGYFVHLFVDCEYAKKIYVVFKDKYGNRTDYPDIRKKFRAEMYAIDCLYLNNKSSQSFEMFCNYNGFSEPYPEWYQNNEISLQMKNIVRYYCGAVPMEMEYQYITPTIMEAFIDCTVNKLLEELKDKNISL